MKKSNYLKRLAVVSAVALGGLMVSSVVYAADTPVYTENFDSYAEGTSATNLGFNMVGSSTITQTAVIAKQGDNQVLQFNAKMDASQGYNLFGITKDIITAGGLSDGENFTLEYDLKMGPTASNQIYCSLSSMKNSTNAFRGAYAFANATTASGNISLWNGDSVFGDNYKSAISDTFSTSSSATYYFKDWNNYRFVVHTASYTDNDAEKQADYADLYINGVFTASLPIRTGDADLKYMAIGYNAQNLAEGDKVSFAIDNLKVYKGEIDAHNTSIASASKADLISTKDFNDLTAGQEYTTANIYTKDQSKWADVRYPNAVKSEGTVKMSAGVLGKAADDIVLSGSGTVIIPFDADTATFTALNAGDSIEYTMQFAIPEGKTNGPSIEHFTGGTNKGKFLRVTTQGIKLCGADGTNSGEGTLIYAAPSIETGKWYDLRYVLTALEDGTYAASVYIDGNVVTENRVVKKTQADGTETDENYVYSAFNRIKLGARDGYIDNFVLRKYTAGYDSTQAEVANAVIALDSDKGIFRGNVFAGDKTLADIIELLGLDNDEKISGYEAVDSDGTVISADTYVQTAAAGKYIRIKSDDCKTYYIQIIANKTIESNITANNIGGFVNTNLNLSDKSGSYGRQASDTSLYITPTDAEKNFWIFKSLAMPAPMTELSFSLLPDETTNLGVNASAYFSANGKTEAEASSQRSLNIVTFKDGKIYTKYSNDTGVTYNNNEWLNVKIRFVPNSSVVRVYINGTIVNDGVTYGPRGLSYLSSVDLRTETGKTVTIDDISIVSGEFADLPQAPKPADSGVLIDLGNVISVPSGTTNNVLDTFVAFNPGTKVGYIKADGTFMTGSDTYTDGTLVALNDGIYKYYTFKQRTNALTVEDTNDGKVVIGDIDDDYDAPAIITAYYDEDGITLKNIEITSVSDDWGTGSARITADALAASYKVNAYLWDTASLTPISGSQTVK